MFCYRYFTTCTSTVRFDESSGMTTFTVVSSELREHCRHRSSYVTVSRMLFVPLVTQSCPIMNHVQDERSESTQVTSCIT